MSKANWVVLYVFTWTQFFQEGEDVPYYKMMNHQSKKGSVCRRLKKRNWILPRHDVARYANTSQSQSSFSSNRWYSSFVNWQINDVVEIRRCSEFRRQRFVCPTTVLVSSVRVSLPSLRLKNGTAGHEIVTSNIYLEQKKWQQHDQTWEFQ